jgi:hypothetical protein
MKPTPLTNDEIADNFTDKTGFLMPENNFTTQPLDRLDILVFARAIETEVNARWEKMHVDLLKQALAQLERRMPPVTDPKEWNPGLHKTVSAIKEALK